MGEWNMEGRDWTTIELAKALDKLRKAVLKHEWWKDCEECCEALGYDGDRP